MKRAIVCGMFICVVARHASAATDSGTIFTRQCSACHTFGKGVLVGPDLRGVTDRHSRAWLTAWISSSERLVRSGDPAANALFRKFEQQRMPDQNMSPGDLSLLLDYLAAGGPEADARKKARRADTATPAEIETGRALFAGQRLFAAGGAPCASCHRVREAPAGGSLGPDLSDAFARFQDKGLTSLLVRHCFPGAPSTTSDESFALKAFLRRETGITR